MPNSDDIRQNLVGQFTGMGQGPHGELGNQEYRRRQEERRSREATPRPTEAPWQIPDGAGDGPREPSTHEPWFPGIDAWFDKHYPRRIRRRLFLLLLPLGLLGAVGAASSWGLSGGTALPVGFFLGLVGTGLVVGLPILLAKLLALAAMLGLVALVLYVVSHLIG